MFITIPPKEEASSKGRLEKLLLLTVNSSLKTTLESLKTDEDEDMELVAKDVALSVRRNKISEERLRMKKTIDICSSAVSQLKATEAGLEVYFEESDLPLSPSI